MIVRFVATGLFVALSAASAQAVYQDGIDISSFQPTVNWTSVKTAGIDFAFTKATEGQNFIDSTFASHMSGAKTAGVLIGPYHFARPDSNNTNPSDAANEANDFVDAITPYYTGTNLTLRPVIDLEKLAGVTDEKTFLSNWINNFQAVVHNRLGFYAIIYVNSNYANNYLNSTVSQYDLWLADWTFSTSSPPAAGATGVWRGWKFWQWTDAGTVSGISGNVDRDVYNGTMQQLSAYIPDFHAGDFDNNGVVDDRDYVKWKKTLGRTVNPGTGADADFSGVVDNADYTFWQNNFGKTYPAGSGASLESSTVPEPTGATLFVLATVGMSVGRVRRRRSSLA